MKTTDTLLAFLLLCGSAKAATIVQTQTFSFTPTATQNLIFNEFDTLGGTRVLNSVTITTSLTKSGGSLYVDNDSPTAATGSISQTVSITLTGIGASLLNSDGDAFAGSLAATTSYSVSLFGDDGDGAGYQAGGPDWGGTTFAEATVGETVTAGNPGTFIGSGSTFTVRVNGTQSTDTAAISGAAGAFGPATASGYVTITYNYTSLAPIPEPGPWMMIGVGLSGALLVRRRSV
ncbi:MAG: choice-of-anchor E domain-containing protein [Akkermansiaceae bacterium]|jgi:hypothetical protein|nr:choice-of-anchor E domain-containing protein [Akkermansiaceae bacterium]